MNARKQSKKKYIVITLLVAFLFGVTTVFVAQMTDEQEGYRTISVVDISGQVSVVKDGIEYSAYPGMLLQEGQEVVTAGDSYVRMVLDDDKYIKLESGSRAVFETLGLLGSGKTQINLERGSLTSELVNPLGAEDSYVVNTPNAVLAVRGTFFRVDLSIQKDGEVTADVMTYGGKVASKRIQPTGEVVDEEVLIDAGYKATINMTPLETHYVVEVESGETIIVDPYVLPDAGEGTETEAVLPIQPITLEDIPDEDLVDVYFAAENGHELFITAEEVKVDLEKRDIKIEEYKPVYEIAEEVKKEQDKSSKPTGGISNTTSALVKADDSQPLAKVEDASNTGGNTKHEVALNENKNPDREKSEEDTLSQENEVVVRQEISEENSRTEQETVVKQETPSREDNDTKQETPSKEESPEEDEPSEEKHVHTLVVEKREATCTEGGYERTSCSTCKELITETSYPMLAHSYTDWTVTKEATCTTAGSKKRICKNCDTASETQEIAANGHIEANTYIDGTETADGVRRQYCSVCNTTFKEEVLLSLPLHFPDTVFREYVDDTFNKDGDNSLSEEELATLQAATTVDVSGTADKDGGVSSLEGIEYFTSLTTLNCDYNVGLEEIDLRENKNVTTVSDILLSVKKLRLSGNGITSDMLPMAGLSGMLEELTLTDCPNLETVELWFFEQLQVLDLSGCTSLTEIVGLEYCSNITTLNLEDTAMTTINVQCLEKLSNLTVNTAVEKFYSAGTYALTALDMSECSNLVEMTFPDGIEDFSDFIVPKDCKVQVLYTSSTQIEYDSTDDYRLFENLTEFISNYSCMTQEEWGYICPHLNEDIEILHLGFNNLNEVDIQPYKNLRNLSVEGNSDIKVLAIPTSDNNLTYLDISGTNLSTENTDLSGCTELEYLDVSDTLLLNDISAIGLEMCTKLGRFSAQNTGLSSAVELFSVLPATLTELDLSRNRLMGYGDAAKFTNLRVLNLSEQSASVSPDEYMFIRQLPNLKELRIQNQTMGDLTGLYLAENVYLEKLYVTGSTAIRTLDLTHNTNLTAVYTAGRYASGEITITGLTNQNIIYDDPYFYY